ncbi:alpha-amylase family glycosyl hydrolase, partial [Priestia megaterium]
MNWNSVHDKLSHVYKDQSEEALQLLKKLVERWSLKEWTQSEILSEKNVYLITYADSISSPGQAPIATLHKFLKQEVGELITDVHLLPMFPFSSDDGFSVTDYRQINPEFGDWKDIEEFSKDYRLMYDFVANHMSKSSLWFQHYLNGDLEYKNYFIPRDEEFDITKVVRPRTSPLFHTYREGEHTKTAWTTFSEDQVDINFKHIPAFIEMTDILLDYLYKGASSIRLDAIGFMWKESGTTCIHLPQTHMLISIWRELVDQFKPGAQIITETNVPHEENISYFGNGQNEANQVYQFSLPPLVLHSYTTHDATKLSNWAKEINNVSNTATYFNFLASHDGIGMRPTEGILTESEREKLVNKVEENGGRVSYKSNPDGTETVYELNINYIDALANG